MNIYPTILTDQLDLVQKQLDLCNESGLVHTVQIDIIDGYFVDNITVAPGDLVGMDFGEMEIDFHLQTQEPIDFVREIIDYQDELPVRSVIGQVEQMSNQELFVSEVRRYGWNVGLSLNIHTPLSAVEPDLWDRINIIQLMGIEAGFQGQELHNQVYTKLQKLRSMMTEQDLQLEVIVDGGVNIDVIAKLQEHGASSVGVGSALWKADDFSQAYQELEAQVL